MSRSGTESVRTALEELGYLRTYHGVRDLLASNDGFLWGELTDRKYGKKPKPITREDFDLLLGDCMAVTDMPCMAFWPELMDAYPDAKVLLVEREIEAWYHSFDKVIVKEVFSWKRDIIAFAMWIRLFAPNPNMFINHLYLGYWRAKDKWEMARNARAVYKEHYDSIEARAKAEGRPVLRMRLEDGWGPMCEFLGKERPPGYEDGKLPRSNEWQKTSANTRYYQNMAMLGVVLQLAKVGMGVAAVVWLVEWFRR